MRTDEQVAQYFMAFLNHSGGDVGLSLMRSSGSRGASFIHWRWDEDEDEDGFIHFPSFSFIPSAPLSAVQLCAVCCPRSGCPPSVSAFSWMFYSPSLFPFSAVTLSFFPLSIWIQAYLPSAHSSFFLALLRPASSGTGPTTKHIDNENRVFHFFFMLDIKVVICLAFPRA